MSKVIIVSGSSRGIGRALCLNYLGKGDQVVGCSRSEGSIVHESYEHYVLDITDEKAVARMVRETVRKHGRIDLLLNNAGIAGMNHLALTTLDSARKILEVNVLGSLLLIRETAKIMIKQKYGRIINFTTIAVPLSLEGEAVYAASKAAIEKITQIAAKELGGSGITVNAVGPTPIATDLIKNIPEDKLRSLRERQAIKRSTEMRDIINIIDFFSSEKSDFVTGQIIYLGGVSG